MQGPSLTQTAKITFITSRAVDIICISYYFNGPWGDEIKRCANKLVCCLQEKVISYTMSHIKNIIAQTLETDEK